MPGTINIQFMDQKDPVTYHAEHFGFIEEMDSYVFVRYTKDEHKLLTYIPKSSVRMISVVEEESHDR